MKQLIEEQILEHFANLEHERWSKWQKYMHTKFVEHSDGKGEFVCLPTELFKRWERQINTPYSELSEQEKQSDRDQVIPYVNWVKQLIDGLIERIKSTQDKYHSIDKKTKEDEYSGGGTCRQCSKRKDSLEIEEIVNILKDLRSQIK